MSLPEESLASRIVEFCRFCRDRGLSAGIKESVDGGRGARVVGISDREILNSALRAVLCSNKDEWDQFDELFMSFWSSAPPGFKTTTPRKKLQPDQPLPQGAITTLMGRTSAGRAAEADDSNAVLGATAQERLRRTDFSEASQNDLPELERIAIRLLRQMSLRLSRRRKSMMQRDQVDLRRTIRRNVSRGGDLIDLRYRAKKIQQNRLVVLLDISGSMNPSSLFFLRFAYALQRHFKRIHTFLFSTQLTEITTSLRGPSLAQAWQWLSKQAMGWSGGTKIGESLKEFVVYEVAREVSPDAVFRGLIDGWDAGPPEAC